MVWVCFENKVGVFSSEELRMKSKFLYLGLLVRILVLGFIE